MIICDSGLMLKLDGETDWTKHSLLLLSGGQWYERRGRVFYPRKEDELPQEDPCCLILKDPAGRVILFFEFDTEEQKEYARQQINRLLQSDT